MPKVFDSSYNSKFAKPNFYNDDQKEEYTERRLQDELFEKEIPPLPTRQMELDYLEQLEKEFKSDPWFHFRFRRIQAGPLRKPYQRYQEITGQKRAAYILNFMIAAAAISPFAIAVGRRLRYSNGGVPMFYHAKNYHNFPNVHPDHAATWRFRKGFYGILFIFGSAYAFKYTKDNRLDEYYSRPDLKPDAIMVEDSEDFADAKKDFYSHTHRADIRARNWEIIKNSPFYRLLRPNHAEYKIRYENRREKNRYNSYDAERGAFPSDSRMHEQHW